MVIPAKTAEPTEMSGIWARVGPRKHLLAGGAHWRNLVNTVEPPVCAGDAALCQTTLTTCFHFVVFQFSENVRKVTCGYLKLR